MLLSRYRPEALLALASASAVLGVSAFLRTRKLSPADVDHYVGILERDLPGSARPGAGIPADPTPI